MSREQVHKLLGGYATGTLTPQEQEVLFQAALEDQEVFDALAREQSLRDLLRDPAAKAHLLAALDDSPLTWGQRASRWMWGHAVGLAAVACFLTVGGYVARQARFAPSRVLVVATERAKVEVNAPQPPAEPAPPRRVFDLETAKKNAATPPELPPPPAIRQRADAGAVASGTVRQFSALDRFSSVARVPAPVPPPASPPPLPQASAVLSLQQGGVAGGVMGGRGGGGGGGGGRPSEPVAAVAGNTPVPKITEQVSVTAMASPVQTAREPQNSKLEGLDQSANVTLKGRDLYGILQTRPGVSFGNMGPTGGSESGAPSVAREPVGNGKLDRALLTLLRGAGSAGVRPAVAGSRPAPGGPVNVQITVTNASADSLAQLRNAGFVIARQDRNELTGRVAVEKLEALTRFAFVVWITPR